ncbi:MAG: hypothetical protein HKN47_07445 [Pirellulaceae bacterium]|nr:hypothetical protein [Pirellulaceae bacterium]
MKYSFVAILLLTVCMGCGSSKSEVDTAGASTPNDAIESSENQYDRETVPVTEVQTIASAIETIATSSDSTAVHEADEFIRANGVSALSSLGKHMNDSRVPPGKSASLYQKTKNVSHTPEMSDYCYWLMLDIVMDSMFARVNREFAPFTKETATDWVAKRASSSHDEIRIDAAKDVLQSVSDFVDENPDDAEAKEIQSFYETQVKVLEAVHAARK